MKTVRRWQGYMIFGLAISTLAISPGRDALANENVDVLVTDDARGGSGSKYLMGTIGDSLSAAAFANTAANSPLGFTGSVINLLDLISLLKNGPKWTAVDNKKQLSWSSGNAIQSHYVRLKNALSKESDGKASLSVYNIALSGAEVPDLMPQAEKLVAEMNSGKYDAVPYITFLIGSNDVCQQRSPEEVYSTIQNVLKRVSTVKQNQSVKVLVSSIPRITELGKDEIRRRKTASGYTCNFIRHKLLKFCRHLTEWDNEREYQEKTAEVARMNDAIEAAATDAAKSIPNLDIQYSASFKNADLTFDLLAADCFHPNRKGHETLAEKLWNDQTWYK